MNELESLQNVLEISIAKNGNKPLTLSHLRNLIGVARRMSMTEEDRMERMQDQLISEFSDPNS